MAMHLIDTHAHLDCPEFAHDYPQVLQRSRAMGVERIILPGVLASGWDHLWQLAQRESMLWAAPGLHPLYVAQHQPEHLERLEQKLNTWQHHPKLCALGEIGLDYFSDTDRAAQRYWLEVQLELAKRFNLPILLHVRRAHAHVIALLKSYALPRAGIVHAFSGSFEEAKEYEKLGFKLGLGGAGTWPQAQRMQRVLKRLPLEALVLETDAPDLAPASHPYQRNSPEYLPEICQTLAELRGIQPEQLAEITYLNSCRLFGWQPSTA